MAQATMAALLAYETQHLSAYDQHQVQDALGHALAYARAAGATVQAIETKLLTVTEAPRWVRVLVAKAAFEALDRTALAA